MPPSDEEMIRHFTTHEVAFRKVYEIMAESSEGSFHYPPLSPEEVIILDSTEQSDTSYESNDEQDIPVHGLLKPTESYSTPCCQKLDVVSSLLTAENGEQRIRCM